MIELTAKQALDFSIKKWEATVANDGQDLSILQSKELGIFHFKSICGLCEKYHIYKEYKFEGCIKCPFNDSFGNGCSNYNHVWYQWYRNQTKENAQIVLDKLKELKH